jgi:putative endopeptidase
MMIKKNTVRAIAACAVGALVLTACKDKNKIYADNDVLIKNIDKSVKPGDDFFKYANGAWLKRTLSRVHIPLGYWPAGEEDLRNKLKKINEDALKANADKGSNTQKIGDFYFSGLDTVNIEKQGPYPLKEELARVDKIDRCKKPGSRICAPGNHWRTNTDWRLRRAGRPQQRKDYHAAIPIGYWPA